MCQVKKCVAIYFVVFPLSEVKSRYDREREAREIGCIQNSDMKRQLLHFCRLNLLIENEIFIKVQNQTDSDMVNKKSKKIVCRQIHNQSVKLSWYAFVVFVRRMQCTGLVVFIFYLLFFARIIYRYNILMVLVKCEVIIIMITVV